MESIPLTKSDDLIILTIGGEFFDINILDINKETLILRHMKNLHNRLKYRTTSQLYHEFTNYPVGAAPTSYLSDPCYGIHCLLDSTRAHPMKSLVNGSNLMNIKDSVTVARVTCIRYNGCVK